MSGDSSLEIMDAYQESPDQNSLAELAAPEDVVASEEDMEVSPEAPAREVFAQRDPNTRFAGSSAGQGASGGP